MSNQEQPLVGLNWGQKFDPEKLNDPTWGRGELVRALDDRDAGIIITTGQEKFDLEAGIVREVLRPKEIALGGITVEAAGVVDLADIGAMRTNMSNLDLNSQIALINEPSVREFSPEKGSELHFGSTPLPREIRGYNVDSQVSLDVLNQSDRPRALRMYWFYDAENPDASQWFPVVRAGEEGTKTVGKGSEWIFVDPETMPGDVVDHTRGVMSTISNSAGVRHIHAGIDLSYGPTAESEDPRWNVVATNTREPIFPRVSGENPETTIEVGRQLNGMLADQLIHMALSETESPRS